MAGGGKMQIQSLVLAQEEIAKGRTAILIAVMVIPRATAGHESYVTGGERSRHPEYARPIGHCLHAARVVRPTRARSCAWQCFDVSGFEYHVRRYLPVPIRQQPTRGLGHVDHAR